MRLIELTAVLERGPLLAPNAGAIAMALIAFSHRSRRLLRAAYRLLDAGDLPEATPLFRVMQEQLYATRWLIQDSSRIEAWAVADQKQRLKAIRGTLREYPELPPEERIAVEAARDEAEEWLNRHEPLVPGGKAARVRVEQMSRDLGLGFTYEFAYRVSSQQDVHATPLSIDACFQLDDGQLRLLPVPRPALAEYDPYANGAYLLLDTLRGVSGVMPELGWSEGLAAIQRDLQSRWASSSTNVSFARR